jgi:amidase
LPGVFGKPDISVVGPLARSAADLDLALDIMGGADQIEGEFWKLALPACGKTSLKEFRVAVKLSDAVSDVDADYADKLQEFVDTLAKKGAYVKEAEPAIDTRRLNEVYVLLLNAAMGARTPEATIEEWKQVLTKSGPEREPYLSLQVAGATMPHREWLKLNNERHAMRMKFHEFFADWDVLLCPVVASAAFPQQHEGLMWERKLRINNRETAMTDQLFWAGYSGVVFLPSTVGPIGFVGSGLPVGYQAIAGQGRDKTSLAFARAVEREIGGFVPPQLDA